METHWEQKQRRCVRCPPPRLHQTPLGGRQRAHAAGIWVETFTNIAYWGFQSGKLERPAGRTLGFQKSVGPQLLDPGHPWNPKTTLPRRCRQSLECLPPGIFTSLSKALPVYDDSFGVDGDLSGLYRHFQVLKHVAGGQGYGPGVSLFLAVTLQGCNFFPSLGYRVKCYVVRKLRVDFL